MKVVIKNIVFSIALVKSLDLNKQEESGFNDNIFLNLDSFDLHIKTDLLRMKARKNKLD